MANTKAHQKHEQAGSTGDEPRANVVHTGTNIQNPLRMGQATCFPGVAAESSAAELEEHTTSGPRLVTNSNLRGLSEETSGQRCVSSSNILRGL